MAEAFLRGDLLVVGSLEQEGEVVVEHVEEEEKEEEVMFDIQQQQQQQQQQEEEEEEELAEPVVVDEVSAVMENLDEFLGGQWDLDAELAQTRAEQERESRGGGRQGGDGATSQSGLMDVGVWD